jgi:segregation and condensation protein A
MYKVNLEIFDGPFDLLLYLIKKNEVSITDIPIAKITQDYLEHLGQMEDLDFTVAGEFLVMAAQLMLIKSRMLLPVTAATEELAPGQEDPRAELVRQLLEYKRYKEASEFLKDMEGRQREVFGRPAPDPEGEKTAEPAPVEEAPLEVSLFELLKAFQRILDELPENRVNELEREEVPVVQKMNEILDLLEASGSAAFSEIFAGATSKIAVVATFLAMLELARMKSISLRQAQIFGEIRLYKLKVEAA